MTSAIKPARRNAAARNAIVEANMPLAHWVVKRVWNRPTVQQMGYEGAVEVALDAMLRAAELWDESFGVKFSTYAVKSMMRLVIREADSAVYFQRKDHDYTKHQRRPVHYPATDADWMLRDSRGGLILAAPRKNDVDARLDLEAAMAALSEREYQVVSMVFYRGMTLDGAGQRLKVTGERARQIKHEAIAKLREAMGGMTWTIVIPNWTPRRANEWRGRHWTVEQRFKRETRDLLCLYAFDGRRFVGDGETNPALLATRQRRVSLLVTLTGRMKQPDRDAYDKVLLDSLVSLGLLLDDGERGLAGRMEVEFQRGSARETRIVLEDVT